MDILTGDEYQDLLVVRGETLQWAFRLRPLDLTGCTAEIVIDTVGNPTMTIAVAQEGAFAVSTLSILVAALTTATWPVGIFDYRVRVTFPNASVLPFGHGKLRVQ